MERVHIDILGPFPPSKSGNVYILMMIDQFTRWVECMPLKDQTAEVVARSAVDNFFSRFGLPSELHSDQGRNFMSNLFVELCERLQIARTRTTPYHPSGNGQVERQNRLLLQLIRAYLGKHQNTWDESLPLLASVMRSAVNRSTGFSANMLMLGRELPLPVEVLFGMSEANKKAQTASSYVTQLCEKLRDCHELAREHLKVAILTGKKEYDVKSYQTSFQPGDLVYQVQSAMKVGESRKLKNPLKGPFLIIDVLSPILYRIKGRKTVSVVHHDRLLKGHDRDVPIWMRRMRNRFLTGQVEDHGDGSLEDIWRLWTESIYAPKQDDVPVVVDKDFGKGSSAMVDGDSSISVEFSANENTTTDENENVEEIM